MHTYWLAPPPQGPTNPECFSTSSRWGDDPLLTTVICIPIHVCCTPQKKPVLLILLTLLALQWRHLLQDRFGLSSLIYSSSCSLVSKYFLKLNSTYPGLCDQTLLYTKPSFSKCYHMTIPFHFLDIQHISLSEKYLFYCNSSLKKDHLFWNSSSFSQTFLFNLTYFHVWPKHMSA